MKIKLLFILLLLGSASFTAVAQSAVTGRVIDQETNEPLPGVSVFVKGTTTGTSSDADGRYTINADQGDVLVFSFIGFQTKEVSVGAETNLEIFLASDITQLSEVVVMGYTDRDKAKLTASVSQVKMEEVGKVTYANVLQALQGRVAGVTFSQDGEPGSGRTRARIRGYTSFNKTDPLIVVDGIPTEEPLDNINPNDIESINVLKDAAASIYGSRSAAGVIVVTTKKGKAGKLGIDAGTIFGLQQPVRQIDVLNASEWGQVYWKAYRNTYSTGTPQFTGYFDLNGNPSIVPDPQFYDLAIKDQTYLYTKEGTNWAYQIYQNAYSQQYYVNVSNGTDKGSVMFGTSYLKQEGIIKTTFYDRVTARLNSNYKFTKWLEVSENMNVSYSKRLGAASQTEHGGIPWDVIRQHPAHPVYDVDGDFAGRVGTFPDVRNTLSRLVNGRNNTSDSWRVFGNVGGSFSPFEAFNVLNDQHQFKLRTNLGIDYSNFFNSNFQPKILEGVYQIDNNSYSNAYGEGLTLTFQNLAEYEFENDNHNFKVLGGIESVQYKFRDLNASRTGYTSETPSYVTIGSGAEIAGAGGTRNGWGLYSKFVQIDYGFKERYLLSANIRHDKTSRFFTDGSFPTVMLGWRITDEPFMQNLLEGKLASVISAVKLRGSYGQMGNQNTVDNLYAAYSTFGPQPLNSNYDISGTNNSVVQGFSIIARGNPLLKWETTTQLNVGADLALLKNKLNVTIDVYKKTTSDLIDNPPTILATGEGTAPYLNIGKIENKGIDLEVAYLFGSASSDLSMGTSLQMTMYRNKVLSLDPAYPLGYEGERYVNKGFRVAEGHPISEFYGFINDGIFQNQSEVDAHAAQTGKGIGRLRFRDVNEDGVIDIDDRTYIGNPHPDVTLGLNLSPRYKNFYLDLFFYSMLGHEIYNPTKWVTDFAQNGTYNRGRDILNAWTPENTGATIPALTLDDKGNDESRSSTYYVEDGSFLKLRTARLGYAIPSSLIKNWKINVYAEVQNALTITKYSGVDPEVPQLGAGNAIGVDFGPYPLPRTFLLGLNFQL